MELKADIDCKFIASNANTAPNQLAWLKGSKQFNSVCAFGAANLVYVCTPHKIYFSLPGASGRINSVKFLNIQRIYKTIILAACTSEGQIIIWATQAQNKNLLDHRQWRLCLKNKISKSSFSMMDLIIDQDRVFIAYFDLAGVLRLNSLDISAQLTISISDQVFAPIKFGSRLQQAIKLVALSSKSNLILLGGYDKLIHIYTFQVQGPKLEILYAASLSGHSNSIKDFAISQSFAHNSFFIASASQDHFIRIWRFQPFRPSIKFKNINQQTKDDDEQQEDLEMYRSKSHYVIDFGNKDIFSVQMESLLAGHQREVSSVEWGLLTDVILTQMQFYQFQEELSLSEEEMIKKFQLLSSSYDFTIAIWKPQIDGTWGIESSMGQASGSKNAYYGATFSPLSDQIFAYTYNGSFHYWKRISNKVEFIVNYLSLETSQVSVWNSQTTISGHFGPVTQLSIQYPQNSFLVTTSSDQTTRVFCKSSNDKTNKLFQISRPQIHGYDINTISLLNQPLLINDIRSNTLKPPLLISGGDEKVIRVFESPYSFIKSMNSLSIGQQSKFNMVFDYKRSNQQIEKSLAGRTIAANQALGLMNKQIEVQQNEQDFGFETGSQDFDPQSYLSNQVKNQKSLQTNKIPVQNDLQSKTLWPELKKLYGHIQEIFTLACTHDGDYIASACKATTAKRAKIVLWDARQMKTIEKNKAKIKKIGELSGHQLTVLQMEFTRDDQFLLSVGRDRKWMIYRRNHSFQQTEGSQNQLPYIVYAMRKQAHTRLIWTASWNLQGEYFVTGSREKENSIKFWKRSQGNQSESCLNLGYKNIPVTAVCLVKLSKIIDVMITGQENGLLTIWRVDFTDADHLISQPITQIHSNLGHSQQISRIASYYSQQVEKIQEKMSLKFASASADHSVRLFKLSLG